MRDRYPQLRLALSSRDGFEQSVAVPSGWYYTIVSCGIGAVMFWLFKLGFAVQARRASKTEPGSVVSLLEGAQPVMMWIAVALLVVTLVALVGHIITKRSRFDRGFASYQTTGHLASTFSTGIPMSIGRARARLVVFAHPAVPEKAVANFVALLQETHRTARESAEAIKLMRRIESAAHYSFSAVSAVSGQEIEPSFPDGVWLTLWPPINKTLGVINDAAGPDGTRPVVLLPNATTGKATVCGLRKNVLVA